MALDPRKRQKKLARQKQKDKARRKSAPRRPAPSMDLPGILAGLSGRKPPSRTGFPEVEQTYRVGVELEGSDPPIRRTLALSSRLSLYQVHEILQTVMPWGGEHLYYFQTEFGFYSEPDPRAGHGDDQAAGLGVILTNIGDSLVYEYDMGDSWRHRLTLEEILPADATAPLARCLGGERAGPPEDSGGVWSYNEAVEILGDPEDPDFEETREILGDDFDPSAFDPAEADRLLAARFPRN